MAPEIWIGEKLVAKVPDETGMHETLSGKPLRVNVDKIDAFNNTRIILDAEEIGGKRVLDLSWDGTGEGQGSKRKGKPPIRVVLLYRPIRTTVIRFTDGDESLYMEFDSDHKETYRNPYWVKKRG